MHTILICRCDEENIATVIFMELVKELFDSPPLSKGRRYLYPQVPTGL